jgi:hypothetical protein
MSMHQTGRFARTVKEAFPQDRYYAVEVFRANPERFVITPAIVFAIVALLVLAAIGALS